MKRRVLLIALMALLAACEAAPTTPPPSSAPVESAATGPSEGGVRLTWHREGGIAGFCDVLTATTGGEAQAGVCNAEPVIGQLTPDERLQLQTWAATFGPVIIVIGDPAAADSLLTTLEMNGLGTGQPTDAEQQAMLDWASAVYARLRPPG